MLSECHAASCLENTTLCFVDQYKKTEAASIFSFSFHLRATLKIKPESPFSDSKEPSEAAPPQPVAPVSIATNPSMDVANLTSSGGYSSPPPSLLAWKQLTGSIPQMPASMPNLPANSPLATTSLENAKPQVKPGFLQFQEKYVQYLFIALESYLYHLNYDVTFCQYSTIISLL